MGVGSKVLAGGQPMWGETRASPCQTQPGPQQPHVGHSLAPQRSRCPVKAYLRTGQGSPGSEGWGTVWEPVLWAEGGAASPQGDHCGAGISLQPMKRTTPGQISTPQPMEHPTNLSRWILPEGTEACGRDPCWSSFFLKDCSLGRSPQWSKGKVWRGKSRREELLETDHGSHFPPATAPLMGLGLRVREGVEDSGIMEWSWAWEKKGGGWSFNLSFFPHYPNLF